MLSLTLSDSFLVQAWIISAAVRVQMDQRFSPQATGRGKFPHVGWRMQVIGEHDTVNICFHCASVAEGIKGARKITNALDK